MIVIVLGILVVAVLADLATNRIPNALIITGLIAGVILNTLVRGPDGTCKSLLSIIVVLFTFYVLFLIKALGAGDVKLLMVIASFLGVISTVRILIISMVAISLYGCIKLVISSTVSNVKRLKRVNSRGDVISVIRNNLINIYSFDLLISRIKNRWIEGTYTRIPFSPFILLATIIMWRLNL